MRGIRSQLESLLQGIPESDLRSMVLGLSHSLSRYKLKFSPDKVDTMIIQAISLLDDLDKELNTYAMRIKEWYGWHFPEMQKIIVDNQAYAKVIKAVGMRTNIGSTDLSTILPEELEAELKEAAEVSMGTEISEEDIENITFLSDQVISISEYRAQLYDYLKNRMAAIAPNLTVLVGELVGARLIAHAGSLMNLAKYPASTVQILGAEKALFRALKTKHDTPKYGLLYHASLVGQAAPKLKGKMARAVATKAALSIRVDALGDKDSPEIGIELRAKTEARLRQLEGRQTHISNKGAGKGKSPMQKFELAKGTKTYNTAADVEMNGETPAKNEKKSRPTTDAEETPNGESEKKKKKVGRIWSFSLTFLAGSDIHLPLLQKDKSEGSSKKRKNEEDADEQPKSEKKKDKRAKKAKKSSSDSD
jgi:nucleolar protein 58